MKKHVIYSSLLHVVIVLVSIFYMARLSILELSVLIYLLPVVLNSFFIYLSMKQKQKIKEANYCFPTLSLISYLIIGLFVDTLGYWDTFIKNNTSNAGDFTVNIDSSLLGTSQIIFVLIIYFSSAYLCILLFNRRERIYGRP